MLTEELAGEKRACVRNPCGEYAHERVEHAVLVAQRAHQNDSLQREWDQNDHAVHNGHFFKSDLAVVTQQRAENARRERGINKDICLLKFTELHQHGSCHAGNRDIPAVGKFQRLDDFKNSERGDKRNGNIECQRKRAVEHDDCHEKCDQRDTG